MPEATRSRCWPAVGARCVEHTLRFGLPGCRITRQEQRFLYVVDGSNKVIRVLNRTTIEHVSAIGGHAGHNAREFFHAHSFAVDSKGNVFIGEVNDGQRYYRYAFRGMRAAGQ